MTHAQHGDSPTSSQSTSAPTTHVQDDPQHTSPSLAAETWWHRHQRAMARVLPQDPATLLDLTTADLVGPGMTLDNTLVLLACSATKRADVPSGGLPLMELYNGSTWQTVRHHLMNWRVAGPRIVVLSGKFGIVSAARHAYPYEARLTREKADALVRGGLLSAQDHFGELRRSYSQGLLAPAPLMHMQRPGCDPDKPETGWAGVIICGGADYRRVFMALLQQLAQWGGLSSTAWVLTASGGIGNQRSQLGRWLDALIDQTPGLRDRLVAERRQLPVGP